MLTAEGDSSAISLLQSEILLRKPLRMTARTDPERANRPSVQKKLD